MTNEGMEYNFRRLLVYYTGYIYDRPTKPSMGSEELDISGFFSSFVRELIYQGALNGLILVTDEDFKDLANYCEHKIEEPFKWRFRTTQQNIQFTVIKLSGTAYPNIQSTIS